MRIVYVADENYKDYLKASIQSYKKYNPKAEIIVVSEQPLDVEVKNFLIPMYRTFRNRGMGHNFLMTRLFMLIVIQFAKHH